MDARRLREMGITRDPKWTFFGPVVRDRTDGPVVRRKSSATATTRRPPVGGAGIEASSTHPARAGW